MSNSDNVLILNKDSVFADELDRLGYQYNLVIRYGGCGDYGERSVFPL
ncbi:FAD linked oxidase domain-containing protein [Roseibium sp. TrichSKD4]|nr:FAD linked oxidase domain-containing protein [Roseibium sp. TrichSKD4]